jgi:hypothetical protein
MVGRRKREKMGGRRLAEYCTYMSTYTMYILETEPIVDIGDQYPKIVFQHFRRR